MAGHESAESEPLDQSCLSIWPDIRSRDSVESDRFVRSLRRYAVNATVPVLEDAGQLQTDELGATPRECLQRRRRG
jgi:hypothetical protein